MVTSNVFWLYSVPCNVYEVGLCQYPRKSGPILHVAVHCRTKYLRFSLSYGPGSQTLHQRVAAQCKITRMVGRTVVGQLDNVKDGVCIMCMYITI